MADNQVVLAFSIIIASLVVSGSIFFAVGSLNSNLAGLIALAGQDNDTGTVPTVQVPTQQPTQQVPEQQPTTNLTMKQLAEKGSFSEGNPDAGIYVVEFSDLQCPFCRVAYNDVIKQVRANYVETGKVYFVYKDFPLSFHPAAQKSAEAVRCAEEQGKGVELHNAIYEFQTPQGQGTITYGVEEIKQQATKIGLEMASFNSCLDSGKQASAVQANFDEGAASGVSGTPSFFIGKADGTGQLIVGAQPYATFRAAIDSLAS